jgi:hypothetical protein
MTTRSEIASRNDVAKANWVVDGGEIRDVVVLCPRCKTMETISLNDKGIVPTRRFTQTADAVFHACGSNLPCRLYSLN